MRAITAAGQAAVGLSLASAAALMPISDTPLRVTAPGLAATATAGRTAAR